MFTPHLPSLSIEDLGAVVGGVAAPRGAQPKQQDNRTWVERLNQNLKQRGFDPSIDPKMERKPPNPNMDPGINQPRPSPRTHQNI